MEEIKRIFIENLGEPDNLDLLEQYIHFCLSSSVLEKCEGVSYQNHHILPKSKFKEYEKDSRFIVTLKYDDHVFAHKLLAEAFHIKSFVDPINLMPINDEENKRLTELRSLSARKQWNSLLSDKEFAKNYSKRMVEWHKTNNYPGSDFHVKVCKGVREFYKNNPDRRKEISEFHKNMWKDMTEEEYQHACNRKRWKLSENYEHRCNLVRDRYKNSEYRSRHIETMLNVNRRLDKREDAGIKLKALWESESYRFNVLNGRKLANEKRKTEGLKRSNSETLKERWKDPEFRERMISARSKKKNETNQC